MFAEIKVGDAVQRLRWISPGTFQMGSPEDEAGRRDAEGPRHEVTLTEGFWLADTPCTQALWQAVMGENPSYFRSAKRPVESMSWDDCQRFFARLNALIPGFDGGLPTEAQWEYACRSGTETATWESDLEILGANHAPVLGAIAWYGGNSGVDFDLTQGIDSIRWKEKQHPHTRAGTREVGLKLPNPWGLYDMLGNVYEWCLDAWNGFGNPRGPRVDPISYSGSGSKRVIRGGSWHSNARLVRAAYRFGREPGSRYPLLGFRLSRGPQVRGPAEQDESLADASGVRRPRDEARRDPGTSARRSSSSR